MSKTDNTDPHWLRAYFDSRSYTFHWCGRSIWRRERADCDAHLPIPQSKAEADARCCGPTYSYGAFVSPSRDDRRIYWWGPERRREREGLTEMAREYNTYGELDTEGDFPNPHHRNSAKWELW